MRNEVSCSFSYTEIRNLSSMKVEILFPLSQVVYSHFLKCHTELNVKIRGLIILEEMNKEDTHTPHTHTLPAHSLTDPYIYTFLCVLHTNTLEVLFNLYKTLHFSTQATLLVESAHLTGLSFWKPSS